MEIKIRVAELSDIDSLAQMNKHLIKDEVSRNPMNISQLTERMKGILEDWIVLVIEEKQETLGYMVYKVSPDEYFPDQSELHIRQYFIKREHRSKGLGAICFNIIREKFFPDNAVLTLDVLEVNPKGKKFWEKVGFVPYLTHMKKYPNDA